MAKLKQGYRFLDHPVQDTYTTAFRRLFSGPCMALNEPEELFHVKFLLPVCVK